MHDPSLLRILEILVDLAVRTPSALPYVSLLLADPYASITEIGERCGHSRQLASYHLYTAAARYPEIRALLRSERRAEVIRRKCQEK
ncbi:MAG: hypothetical protein IJI85_10170 [Clostridia bacterium]|nr:hypothetical protein [Lentisphaeria bacterium]MBR0422925.1 hypothetical protein [Clostridia bacterium]